MIQLPNTNIRILRPLPELYYYDRQDMLLPEHMRALTAWNGMTRDPQPFLKVAFQIRDAISSVFGVKRIGGFSGKSVETVSSGQYLDFFLVEYVDDTCLVLTERDRHLDVMTCISTHEKKLSVTSSVCVHNLFGRLYMIPVGIAHRWIVRGMFRRYQKQLG
ncbi:DUF2867 domain-containing protein [Shimia sp. R10_1]|nr:DUF2867 domain-containing protein [Shimia sp. R10_1]